MHFVFCSGCCHRSHNFLHLVIEDIQILKTTKARPKVLDCADKIHSGIIKVATPELDLIYIDCMQCEKELTAAYNFDTTTARVLCIRCGDERLKELRKTHPLTHEEPEKKKRGRPKKEDL